MGRARPATREGVTVTAIDYFANTDTVRIATEQSGGGEVVTPIWSVVVDNVPYIRSAYGPGSKWYRRARRTGRAEFIDESRRYPVTIENVDDDMVNDRVDGAYQDKYAGSEYLAALLTPETRSLTMRVNPR